MLLESYVVDLIEGRKKSSFLLGILRCLSFLYQLGIAARHCAYDKKWFRSSKASIPIVSVGNITTGGTGKTPLVHLLAKEFSQVKKVAILTRGFRSKAEHAEQSMRINQTLGYVAAAEECGDEPLLLSRLLPSVDVWVGKNRIYSAKRAKAEGSELLFLDDGLQHRRLDRDFEVVILDGKDPFGAGFFLPRGFLRDSLNRLKKADLIVINHIENAEHFTCLEQRLNSLSKAPVVGTHMSLDEGFLKGKKLGLFCGLGKPQRFIESVQKAGADIVDVLLVPDHRRPDDEQLKCFAEKCSSKGAEYLICTDKDLIKLNNVDHFSLPIVSISGTLEIVFGKEKWLKALERIHNL